MRPKCGTAKHVVIPVRAWVGGSPDIWCDISVQCSVCMNRHLTVHHHHTVTVTEIKLRNFRHKKWNMNVRNSVNVGGNYNELKKITDNTNIFGPDRPFGPILWNLTVKHTSLQIFWPALQTLQNSETCRNFFFVFSTFSQNKLLKSMWNLFELYNRPKAIW